MKRFARKPLLALVLVAGLMACGEDKVTPPEPMVTGVEITPATVRLEFLGASLQLVARVFRDNGSTVTNPQITWASADPSVVSVDAQGAIIATGPGETEVTATYLEFSAAANVVVSTPDCVNDVSLSPGAWATFSIGCAISVPAGEAGDRYRVAVVSQDLSENASFVTTTRLGVVGTAIAEAAPAQLRTPFERREAHFDREDEQAVRLAARVQRNTERHHVELRANETRLLEAILARGPLNEVRREVRRQEVQSLRASAAQLDQRIMFRPNPGNSCTVTPAVPAFLIAENDHMAIYQDSALMADPGKVVTESQAQRLLDFYSEHGKSVIDNYFSGVSDIDNNGKILLVASFHTPLQSGGTAAYVWGADLFSTTDCETSNEAEITYFNAALIQAMEESDFPQALETVVHEVKHIASFGQGLGRSRDGVARFQPSWIEEGAAEIAGNIAGRSSWAAVGGPAVNERVTAVNLLESGTDGDGGLLDEVFSSFARLIRVQDYLNSQPNGVTVEPFGANPRLDIYGTGWTFLRWFGDAYGNASSAPFADASLFAAQNDSASAEGVGGLEAIAGKPFAEILEEYAAGLMLHMTPSAPPGISFDSFDFVSSIELFCFGADNPPCAGETAGPAGTFPWPVTTQADGTMSAPFATGNFSGSMGVTGVRIHEFLSAGTGGIQIQVDAAQPSKIVVARIN